jgi:hypothetical protein
MQRVVGLGMGRELDAEGADCSGCWNCRRQGNLVRRVQRVQRVLDLAMEREPDAEGGYIPS